MPKDFCNSIDPKRTLLLQALRRRQPQCEAVDRQLSRLVAPGRVAIWRWRAAGSPCPRSRPPGPFYLINVAARLEGINKQFGTTICISDSIYDQAQADLLARPIKRVQVKGRKTEFMIYELLALRASDDPDLRIRDRDEQRSAMTWDASQKFEARDFAEAERAYRAILDKFPGDPVAKFMLKECEGSRAADLPDTTSVARGTTSMRT